MVNHITRLEMECSSESRRLSSTLRGPGTPTSDLQTTPCRPLFHLPGPVFRAELASEIARSAMTLRLRLLSDRPFSTWR